MPVNANPTQARSSMAGAIERYFNLALYLLVLSGFGTLASTGGLDLVAVTIVSIALVLRGYQLLAQRVFVIPERWTTYLTLIYIVVYFADYFLLSGSFLTATVHLVLFTMVVRLFSLQRTRDHYMLSVLSFLMVLAAAVLTVGSLFLFAFAGFLLVAVITFVLMEMQHSATKEPVLAQDSRTEHYSQQMAHRLLAIAPALVLLILGGSFFIFFLLPRVSSRYLTAYTPTSDVSTGFTDRVQLGRIGQIQQSSAVVMHIEIQNDVQGAYDLKWRGVALNTFDGRVWSNSFEQRPLQAMLDGIYHLVPPRTPSAPASRLIHYRVLMEPLGTNVFFLAERPRSLTGNYRLLGTDSGDAVFNLDADHPVGRYEANSELPVVDPEELRSTPDSVPEAANEYLKLPPLDVRIAKLAEQITASSPSNYDKALALEAYLRTHFGYSLDLPRTTPRDPLAYFLFVRKEGHCEYFASSMAVMLRTLGIPSRLITGFRTGEFNDLTGQYVVRASNAHSWVEAYFPGQGWISFDPTPGGSLPTRTGWSRMQLYMDAAASFWREWIINYDSGHQRALGQDAASNTRGFVEGVRSWLVRKHRALLRMARHAHRRMVRFPIRWIGGTALAGCLLLLVVNLRRIVSSLRNRAIRAHPARAPRQSAALWYDRMVTRLARLGWRKLPSQTPTDFVTAIRDPRLQQRVANFTKAYRSARFGQSPEDAAALPGLFKEITEPQEDQPVERAVS